MAKETNITRVGVVGIEDALRYAIGKFSKDHPQARPAYAFRYRVTANYKPVGGLQAELAAHGVALPNSEAKLFDLAKAATSRSPKDSEIRALVTLPVGYTAREDANLPGNIRRRLVFWFAPESVTAYRDILQLPETDQLKIYQSGTVSNHLGQDLAWIS